MAKSKEQKRKEALVRAKEHYRDSALHWFLRIHEPKINDPDFPFELYAINKRWLPTLVRQANLAKVDLDGCDLEGVVMEQYFDDPNDYSRFYSKVKRGWLQNQKENYRVTRIGSAFNSISKKN